jgi:hypothetical protein
MTRLASGQAVPEANRLPHAAREGLMRAWLAVLSQRHPEVTWIPAATPSIKEEQSNPELKHDRRRNSRPQRRYKGPAAPKTHDHV